ncbi:hypothetical protein CAEBREN_13251 [Caenorhabditis brenneri]|uniref:Sdz-33 F-box domain-containing protein n=1 Tax=Caenorhabditis brenneri TaxID=135651 RepID=G0N0B4_CAEBE|nr:hypothetical protein CAEBREN_13251 [Caenorhabditis brenneri]
MAALPPTRLSTRSIHTIIQYVSPIKLLLLSRVSEQSRKMVKDSQINSGRVYLDIGESMNLSIIFAKHTLTLKFVEQPQNTIWNEFGQKVISICTTVDIVLFSRIGELVSTFRINDNNCTISQWISHLKFIYNSDERINVTFELWSSQYDQQQLRNIVGLANQLKIRHSGDYEYNRWILNTFASEELVVSPSCFRDFRVPLDVMMRAYKTIGIINQPGFPQVIDLNDFLTINSKSILIFYPSKHLKSWNFFFRLWANGSSPHIESLLIVYLEGGINDADVIMAGIPNEIVPENSIRIHGRDRIRGGHDIYNINGTKATILFSRNEENSCIRFVVWHDHCAR